MPAEPEVLKARDLMTTDIVTVRDDQDIFEAIKVLMKRRVSGAPVLDGKGELVGFLSEKDCITMLAAGTFHDAPSGQVSDLMTREVRTISPDLDIYSIAGIFLRNVYRRLPVVEGGRAVGYVSRRNVLAGIERMRHAYHTVRQYPDYREPQ